MLIGLATALADARDPARRVVPDPDAVRTAPWRNPLDAPGAVGARPEVARFAGLAATGSGGGKHVAHIPSSKPWMHSALTDALPLGGDHVGYAKPPLSTLRVFAGLRRPTSSAAVITAAPGRLAAVKALLPVGIVLIIIGIAVAFGQQIVVAITTGLPSTGIVWVQTLGFLLAAAGAVCIGSWVGRRRKLKRAQPTSAAERRRDV